MLLIVWSETMCLLVVISIGLQSSRKTYYKRNPEKNVYFVNRFEISPLILLNYVLHTTTCVMPKLCDGNTSENSWYVEKPDIGFTGRIDWYYCSSMLLLLLLLRSSPWQLPQDDYVQTVGSEVGTSRFSILYTKPTSLCFAVCNHRDCTYPVAL